MIQIFLIALQWPFAKAAARTWSWDKNSSCMAYTFTTLFKQAQRSVHTATVNWEVQMTILVEFESPHPRRPRGRHSERAKILRAKSIREKVITRLLSSVPSDFVLKLCPSRVSAPRLRVVSNIGHSGEIHACAKKGSPEETRHERSVSSREPNLARAWVYFAGIPKIRDYSHAV